MTAAFAIYSLVVFVLIIFMAWDARRAVKRDLEAQREWQDKLDARWGRNHR